jgi:hypothetical protein
MEIVNWRQVAQDRNGWRRATREALILLGQQSHRRRRRNSVKYLQKQWTAVTYNSIE